MDRTLKVYAPTGHLFAEFSFYYDQPRQATAKYIQYRRLYNDDEEDESKSVYPRWETDLYLSFVQFDSIEKIKAHDRDLVKKESGRDMTAPGQYTYVYDADPVLQRYVAANHTGCIGMINIAYSFINNTKEVRFLSAEHPRFDWDLSSHSLETNLSCILRIPLHNERIISVHDLNRLPPWY